jgi:DNA-binding NarL/FixJ family response regulator
LYGFPRLPGRPPSRATSRLTVDAARSRPLAISRIAVNVPRLGMAGIAAVAVATMGFALFMTLRAESHSTRQERPMGALTAREVEIVRLLAEGKVNKQIAAMLGITARTVETHRARIMLKLGVHSLAELIHYAIRNNIVSTKDL